MPVEHSLASFVKQLPRTMQLRFDALGGYVKAVAREELRGPDRESLSNDKMAFIQLMVFVYMLDRFLRDGTRAARGAAETFDTLGATGFAVGNTLFTRTNANTTRGERLADAIRVLIADTKYAQLLRDTSSMRDLVRNLIREVASE